MSKEITADEANRLSDDAEHKCRSNIPGHIWDSIRATADTPGSARRVMVDLRKLGGIPYESFVAAMRDRGFTVLRDSENYVYVSWRKSSSGSCSAQFS